MPARGERAGTLNRLGDLVPRQCAALPTTHLVQLCSDASAIICGASPRFFEFFPLGHCPGPRSRRKDELLRAGRTRSRSR
ncbi:hypothetical protein GOD70_30390 [Sinorhizobium medicae]|nr:hypothetical protein [Sinorhizobium medicae]MDX0790705.1 hypothetical protein [Sinorhizobium medicae]MDX1127886.1 hypothetical protein [Sinorhizobium medicae]MDX1231236.1 hypothetical protein [Sinorhizobium medicae]